MPVESESKTARTTGVWPEQIPELLKISLPERLRVPIGIAGAGEAQRKTGRDAGSAGGTAGRSGGGIIARSVGAGGWNAGRGPPDPADHGWSGGRGGTDRFRRISAEFGKSFGGER